MEIFLTSNRENGFELTNFLNLFSIHKGISFRTKLKGKEILVMARSILSFDSSGEFPAFDDIILDVNRSSTQESSTYLVNNNPVLILFALRLIKSVLKECSTKNIPEGHRKEYFNIFEDILIINKVKYKVIPMGIKTTIPAIKLFLKVEKIDFFGFFVGILPQCLNRKLRIFLLRFIYE